MNQELLLIGEGVVEVARSLGSTEVTAWVSQGTWTDVKQRDGKIEKWQDSRSRSMSAALLVEDRYSVHTTNDLRPDALRAFLESAVAATRYLEVDADRRLPALSTMGKTDAAVLDLSDDRQDPPIDHRAWVNEMQQATTDAAGDKLRSAQGFVWSGGSEQVMVTSNGFSGGFATSEYGHGATLCMEDKDGKLPEAYEYNAARHHADLRGIDIIARDAAERNLRRLGSGPVDSHRGAMLVENRCASRIISTLVGPLSGHAIYEQRSCMTDKLGESVAASHFSLYDDPHVPRGMGSRPYDGDGRPTTPRPLVEDGVLQTWLLDVYNARRLGREPTIGGTSNLIIEPGGRSPDVIIGDMERVIWVDGFLGGNSNAATGRYSFGIRGTMFENGEAVAPISEMNISGSIFDLMNGFVEAGDDPWTTGSCRSPSLLFDAVQFSGQ